MTERIKGIDSGPKGRQNLTNITHIFTERGREPERVQHLMRGWTRLRASLAHNLTLSWHRRAVGRGHRFSVT